MLTPGSNAPQFELLDAHENKISLTLFAGRNVLVYFYPRADTPGCTTQACELQAAASMLGDTVVIGISPDKPAALAKFATKYGLEFHLLSDLEHTVAESYGAWGEKKNYGKTYFGIIRSAVLIDAKGKVITHWPKISPKDTVPELLKALGS